MEAVLGDRELSGWTCRGRVLSCRFRQPERQLAIHANGFVVALVGFHDLLHQAVAHNVAIVELHELDALDAAQNVGHFDQSGLDSESHRDLFQREFNRLAHSGASARDQWHSDYHRDR